MISISGVFAVTFSVVFAYVADVTTTEDRSRAYGLVSATFAASLVSWPLYFVFNLVVSWRTTYIQFIYVQKTCLFDNEFTIVRLFMQKPKFVNMSFPMERFYWPYSKFHSVTILSVESVSGTHPIEFVCFIV